MDPVKSGGGVPVDAHAAVVTSTVEPSRSRAVLLLDRLTGGSRWGRFDVWPTRYGFTHYRLVVLPPGATDADRLLLELRRSAALLAALLAVGLFLAADLAGLPTGTSGLLAAVAGGAVLAGIALRTRRLRAEVRTCDGGVDHAGGREHVVGAMSDVMQWSLVLLAADRALQDGEITVAQHELIWSRAWHALPRPGR